jgi:glucosamine-phosphate N-acetyltransferase
MAVNLFPAEVLTTKLPAPYILRPLQRSDYEKGYSLLLSQLTEAAGLNANTFMAAFDEILADNKQNLRHFIVVVEDTENQVLAATGTLIVERKFIRGVGLVSN